MESFSASDTISDGIRYIVVNSLAIFVAFAFRDLAESIWIHIFPLTSKLSFRRQSIARLILIIITLGLTVLLIGYWPYYNTIQLVGKTT